MNDNFTNIKAQLSDYYRYRIEMHAHTTPVSPCSQVTPQELVRTYSKLGYDAVCLTNHFISLLFRDCEFYQGLSKEAQIDRYIADFETAAEEGEKCGIKVLLGTEIRFADSKEERFADKINDYLIYGVDKNILLGAYDYLGESLEVFRTNFDLPNSVFVQAHPFRSPCSPAVPSLLDGIEAYNMHTHHNQIIPHAVKFAADNKIGIVTCGSDFHHPNEGNDGTSALRTHILPNDSFELASILRSGDYIMELGGNDFIL